MKSTALTGKYKAKLIRAKRIGDAVEFTWEIGLLGHQATSSLALRDERGYPNVAPIRDTQAWAAGWDGRDLDWFEHNVAHCSDVNITLTDGKVDWVFPIRTADSTTTPTRYASTPVIIKLVVRPEALKDLPDEVEPTAGNALALFDAVTAETDHDDACKVWTMMAGEIGPYQVDFTPEQWSKMIGKIRTLHSKTFTLKG